MKVLVTGAAGFIGFHFCLKRLELGDEVTAIDNINDYYDVNLKYARLNILSQYENFKFHKLDLSDQTSINRLFKEDSIDCVVNLAAQAGVRHSLKKPMDYVDSNLVGFTVILEACRHYDVAHLVYASSSSVYGANRIQPFSEGHGVDHPLALYAATKRYNELAAHAYSSLYGLPTTGLRFFSVYGPWGRPDMALFKFTKNILEQEPIDVYNHGNMIRDFTYIDDIVNGISQALDNPAQASEQWCNEAVNAPDISYAPFRIYNIGNGKTIDLMRYIEAIENNLGKKAILNFLPMQEGDVYSSCADVSSLEQHVGYRSKVSVLEGIAHFIEWYRHYYKI